jgi:glycerophosphoryl diester phosphodiesterase
MSFSYTALQRMDRFTPELPLVMLLEKKRAWPMLKNVIGRDWILGPGIDLLQEHPRFARRLAASGHDLHVWTVNSEAQLDTCLELGVKAVITDRPAYLQGLLAR